MLELVMRVENAAILPLFVFVLVALFVCKLLKCLCRYLYLKRKGKRRLQLLCQW